METNEVFEHRKKHMKLLNYTLFKLLEIEEIYTAVDMYGLSGHFL